MGKFISLPGYPTASWGATKVARGDFFGTNNYQAGGELIVPGTFGLGAFETAGASFSGYSYSNNYFARVVAPNNLSANGEQLAPVYTANASNGNNTNQLVVKWFIASNNAEVANNTNLSAEGVRFTAEGV